MIVLLKHSSICDTSISILDKTKYFWQVSSTFPSTYSNIYHRTCDDKCPQSCSNEWRYFDASRKWNADPTIKLKCGTILQLLLMCNTYFQDFILKYFLTHIIYVPMYILITGCTTSSDCQDYGLGYCDFGQGSYGSCQLCNNLKNTKNIKGLCENANLQAPGIEACRYTCEGKKLCIDIFSSSMYKLDMF